MMMEPYWKQLSWVSEPVEGIRGFRFDLQLFSAEDEGRTEEPTEKKLREAREKGQVAKTPELPQAAVVMFSFLVIFPRRLDLRHHAPG